MKEVTHIVPVGHTKETLVESLRRFPVGRIILVLGDDPGREGERKARRIAEEVKRDMGSIPCEEIYVNLDDVLSTTLTLVRKIREETGKGCEVKLNLSGSLRSVNIAGYLTALMTSAPAYVGIPEYKGDRISGIREIQYMPCIPLKELSGEKKGIIKLLSSGEGMYLEDLISKLKPRLHKSGYDNERSRLSYHIKDLRRDGFVETVKEGRNLKIKLSGFGRVYAEGLVSF